MAGIPEDSTPKLVVKRGTAAKSLRLILPAAAAPPATPASGAVALWREKLAMLLEAEALETEAARKFLLVKQIEEARRKINELGGTT